MVIPEDLRFYKGDKRFVYFDSGPTPMPPLVPKPKHHRIIVFSTPELLQVILKNAYDVVL